MVSYFRFVLFACCDGLPLLPLLTSFSSSNWIEPWDLVLETTDRSEKVSLCERWFLSSLFYIKNNYNLQFYSPYIARIFRRVFASRMQNILYTLIQVGILVWKWTRQRVCFILSIPFHLTYWIRIPLWRKMIEPNGNLKLGYRDFTKRYKLICIAYDWIDWDCDITVQIICK